MDGRPGFPPALPGVTRRLALRALSLPPRQIVTSAVGRCLFPIAKFLASAVGRCPFPIAIYGEGVADRPGVRSNVRVLSPTGEIAHERSRIER